MEEAINKTKSNTGLILNLALSYSSRNEILYAVKGILDNLKSDDIVDTEITEDVFSEFLYTKGLRDPDLLIRTSGESRISNFLLWNLAYTERCFSDVLWPDFGVDEVKRALDFYVSRQRRFGRTGEQIKGARC